MITRAEYLLLVAAAAQKIAGPGKTPTSGQVRAAETKMKDRLAKRNMTVSGCEAADRQLGEVKRQLNQHAVMGWDAGSFWSKVKNVAATAVHHSKPYLPYAAPLLPAAAATPFIIKAIRARQAAQRAQQAAQGTPSPSPSPSPETAAEAPAEEAPMSTPESEGQVPQDDSLSSLMGNWGGWDEREMMAGVTAEERELARTGGSSERAALIRRALRCRRRRAQVSGALMPHDVYRAAIWQRAQKLKAAGQPQARALFVAQKSVDRDMSRGGVSVAIPGARPGRVTR